MAFGGENAESYYDEGLTASMKGELTQAISFFEQAIRMDSSMSAAYHQLGRCYFRMGKIKKSVAFFQQVVQAKPKLIPPQVDLGYAFLKLDEVNRARDCFDAVLQRKPMHARAQLGLAMCAYAESNWDAAVELALSAVAQSGANFAAFYLLGRAANLAGRLQVSVEYLQRAEALMSKAIETSPEQPEAYFLRGEVFFAQQNFAKAVENYAAAIEKAQRDQYYVSFGEHFSYIDILAKKGLALQRLGENAEAVAMGQEILKLAPEHTIGKMLAEL